MATIVSLTQEYQAKISILDDSIDRINASLARLRVKIDNATDHQVLETLQETKDLLLDEKKGVNDIRQCYVQFIHDLEDLL
jgi:hypothetical protein